MHQPENKPTTVVSEMGKKLLLRGFHVDDMGSLQKGVAKGY